ncbi:MAG: lactonase family protein [Porphyrobacter sp.]|nr:lactonase family protein [Porphyrobacter sp.]
MKPVLKTADGRPQTAPVEKPTGAVHRDCDRASLRVLVGTYARNGGAGLHALRACEAGGWVVADTYSGAKNASFGTYSARHDLYYFVDEQAEGALGAFRDTTRGWEQAGRVPAHGGEPCYVALNGDQSLLAVANYGSGSIALYRIDEATGLPLEPAVTRGNAGSGPVADRQDGPHAHCVCFSPDQRWLYHVDLGTDQVLAHALDAASGSLEEQSIAYHAPSGSGPRHLLFHPVLPLAVLVSELASTLTVLQVEDGRLIERQSISTLPPGFAGDSLGGHLAVDAAGERVYVTNRGHDSLAVFAWDATGRLELLQHVPSGGASPRCFVLLEAARQLLLANEEGGTITAFGIGADGTLSPLDTDIDLPGAAFLLVAPR